MSEKLNNLSTVTQLKSDRGQDSNLDLCGFKTTHGYWLYHVDIHFIWVLVYISWFLRCLFILHRTGKEKEGHSSTPNTWPPVLSTP